MVDEIAKFPKVQKNIETKIEEYAKAYKGFEDFGSIQKNILNHTERDREEMVYFYKDKMVRTLIQTEIAFSSTNNCSHYFMLLNYKMAL